MFLNPKGIGKRILVDKKVKTRSESRTEWSGRRGAKSRNRQRLKTGRTRKGNVEQNVGKVKGYEYLTDALYINT
jgi:hypothetical protein